MAGPSAATALVPRRIADSQSTPDHLSALQTQEVRYYELTFMILYVIFDIWALLSSSFSNLSRLGTYQMSSMITRHTIRCRIMSTGQLLNRSHSTNLPVAMRSSHCCFRSSPFCSSTLTVSPLAKLSSLQVFSWWLPEPSIFALQVFGGLHQGFVKIDANNLRIPIQLAVVSDH